MLAWKRAVSLVLLILGFTCIGGQARGISLEEILKKMDLIEQYKSIYAESIQVITTSDGEKRAFKIKSWAVNTGEKQLMEYTSPARVKGVKILMLKDGDDIWSYSPRSRRIRHLASHAKKQKVMGSDFTYEDMGGGKMSEKYTGRVAGEEKLDTVDCYVLELTPTPEGPSYEKIVVWAGKKDFMVRRIDYYETGGSKAFKTLFLSDIRKISGHITPMKIRMVNHLDGGETLNEYTRIEFDRPIPDNKFRSSRLDRK
ncbi:MAG: outer membrane lipoprotein-sorting protein [Deltaproteobacteria bacterium]|nr:outer membrane lipoprotein-sorting protein [Deltaproteobacteria bacterium]